MHNGFLDGFHDTKRDLVLAVDPALYPEIEGTTDTELMFHLALTFGLEDDPPQAVARMVGFVEATGHAHGVEFPFQGTIATTDGERVWAFRYSSEGKSRSLFFSTDLRTLRELYPDAEEIPKGLDDESRLVVSEPLGDLPGVWNEVPEASYGVIQPGQDEMHPFVPTTDAVPA
jgi:glutamine amidotransferase